MGVEILIGLLVGYWAKDTYKMLKNISDDIKYRYERQKTGVIRPTPNVKSPEPKKKTGVVKSMSPAEFKMREMEEREKRLQNL